jgi:hypothetical protein
MTITPEQFNKIALKQDLVDLEERLEQKFASKEDIRNITQTLDYVVKKLDKIDSEQTANLAAHDRMQATTENHEIRIEKLELKTTS